MALLEELRAAMTAKLEELSDHHCEEQCSDTILSALDSAIAAKCLALSALQDANTASKTTPVFN